MTARLKPSSFEFETTWIREYARAYLPDDSAFTFSPERLRQAEATLLDIRNVFRFGEVVFSDKLEEPGALWVVEGDDCEGNLLRVCVTVISETLDVNLFDVIRI